MKLKQTETDLVRAALEYLHLRGIFAWKNQTTGMYDPTRKRFRTFNGLKGVGDILGVLPGGRFLSIEAKVGKNKPSDDQLAFMERANREGGLAFAAWSIDDIERKLAAEAEEQA